MDAIIHARLEGPAQFFKALSHASRLYMIEELLHGEKCVLELTALVGADISTVSKHLTVLSRLLKNSLGRDSPLFPAFLSEAL